MKLKWLERMEAPTLRKWLQVYIALTPLLLWLGIVKPFWDRRDRAHTERERQARAEVVDRAFLELEQAQRAQQAKVTALEAKLKILSERCAEPAPR